MKPTEKIEKLLETMTVTPASEKDRQMLNAILQAQAESKQHPSAPPGPGKWRIVMHNNITKSIAAAVIVLAVLIGINMLNGAPAWADVLDHVNNTRSVTYQYTLITENFSITSTEMQMEPGLWRTETPKTGTINIRDLSTGARLYLDTKAKSASLEHTINNDREFSSKNRYAWLKTLHTQDTKFTDTDEIDGVKVNVFICEYPYSKTTVWVDAETCLPVRMEFEAYPNTEAGIVIPEMKLAARDFGYKIETFKNEKGNTSARSGPSVIVTAGSGSRTSGYGLQDRMTMIYHDFNWNAELDTSLFSMVPPEGYKIRKMTIDASEPAVEGQGALVYALQFWISNTNGKFPDTIDVIGDSDKIKRMLIAQFDKDGDPEKEWNTAWAEARKIFRGIAFTLEKKIEKSWGYAGEGVALGQADRVVCWWFDKDENSYKAVFGDLSIQEVTQDQLPIQP